MAEVRIGVLGPTSVTVDGVRVMLRSSLARRLLAALVLHRPAGASVDRLADELWGDDLPRSPAGALANHVARLRATLGADVIEGFPGGYRLGPVPCDVDELAVLASGELDAPDRLRAADELSLGHPYADLDSDIARAESARLDELCLGVREAHAEALLRAGDPVRAVGAARALIEQHPLRERARLVHAEALAATGRTAEGLRSLADLRHVLVGELGLDPSPTAVALERRLLSASEPIRRRPIHPVEPLVGRDTLLDQLADLAGRHRLVTLVGPGGVGKTALVTAVSARQLSGIVGFVELTAARHDPDVAAVVATQLGVDRTGGEQWNLRIADALAYENGLLVLDNAEHVIHGVTALASDLLRSTPLHLAVTSRVALALPGERVDAVPPLQVGEDAGSPAIALFATTASRVRDRWATNAHDTAMVARICRQVDGLPLGIELAAAQLRYRTLHEIAERLDRSLDALDGDQRMGGRHGGLRAVLDRSWALLQEQDQLVLSRIALFLGGFGLTTAAAVCSDLGPDPALVEASLDRLLDASLLTRSDRSHGTHYSLLDTVRRYALEHLDVEGVDADARDRHAQAILTAVEDGANDAYGPGEKASAELLADTRPDLFAAFEHLTDLGAARDALRLAIAAYLLAPPRRQADIAELPSRAIACSDQHGRAQRDGRLLVEALGMAADAATLAGAHDEARVLLERARSIGTAGSPMRYCRAVEADLALYLGDVDAAVEHCQVAADGFMSEGQPALAAWMRGSMALARAYGAHPDDQVGAALGALEAAKRSGCPSAVAFCRYVYAEVVRRRDAPEARRHLDIAVAEATGVGADFVAGLAQLSLATAALERGDLSSSATALRSLLDLWRRLGNWTQQWTTVRSAAILLARADRHRDALLAIAAVRRHAPVDAWGEDAERIAEATATAERMLGPEGVRKALDLAQTMSVGDVVQRLHNALAEIGEGGDR